MQTIIDLDLREVVSDFTVKSPAPPYAGKSQDTQSHEVYFVQGGAVQDLGTGPAIKYGLIGPASPSLLVLCTSYTRQVDVNGNIFYLGFPIFNTSNLASALGTNTSIACISEVRYQLSSGEIEHTLDIPITIFRTILSEITSDTTTAAFTAPAVGTNVTIAIGSTTWLQVGQQLTIATAGIYQVISITDATHFVAQNTGQPGNAISGTVIASGSAVAGAPVNALTTYPPSNTLELISTRDVASGHAGLTAAKLLNPVVIPVDGDTITIVAGQLSNAAIITDTTANFTTPAANATVSVAVVSTAALVVGQFVRIPIAGYYKVTTITDATDVVLTNVADPWNAAAGVVITTGAALLPAQATAGSGGGTPGQNAYTLTTASFIVPAVGATVSVAMVTTAWLGGNGYYVFITGAGYYAVGSITDGTHAVLTNAGGTSNAPPGTTVPTNTQVAACGPPGAAGASGAGLAAYDALASAFTMPAVSGTVTITIGNTAWLSVNQIIYIATAGYLKVSAISSATQVLVTNLNYPGNATAATVIASGSTVSPGGLQGPQGAGGAGLNAFTTLSANFTQPAVNATVSVNVGSTAWMAAGQGIFIQGGGYYTIQSISDATHAVVSNLGTSGNATPGSTVTGSGTQNVTPAGTPGLGGNAYTTITASFTQPALGTSVTVSMASTAWLAQNQYVFITGGGLYSVSSILNATQAILISVAATGTVSSGTTVSSGSTVTPAGPPGPQGAQGIQGAPGSLSSLGDTLSTATGTEVSMQTGASAGVGYIKKLKAGTNITLTDQGGSTGDVLIAASGGGGGMITPDAGIEIFEDFDHSTASGITPGWTLAGSGASVIIPVSPLIGTDATNKASGVVGFQAGAGALNRSEATYGSNTIFDKFVPALGILDFRTRVWVPALYTSTANYSIFWIGLQTENAGSLQNGIIFEYNYNQNAGNWIATTIVGNTVTRNATTGAVVAGTWMNLRILTDATWANVNFYMNGTLIKTLTSFTPYTAVVPIQITNMFGAGTPQTIYVDLVYMKYSYSRGTW